MADTLLLNDACRSWSLSMLEASLANIYGQTHEHTADVAHRAARTMVECERRTSDKAKGEVRVNGGLVKHLLELQSLASPCYTDSKYLPDGPVPCTCPGMFNCPRRGCSERCIHLRRPDGRRLLARMPRKHRMAGKGISLHSVRTLTGDVVSVRQK